MTLQSLYEDLNTYALGISLIIFLLPWLVWIICALIPGEWEEPWLLSFNLALAVASIVMWAGYLAYASNTAGWNKVVQEANVLLLLAPPYYILTSLWVARQRLPLGQIPLFRTLQGVMIMSGVYVVLAGIIARIRIHIVFLNISRMPFSVLLWFLAGLILIGYLGYRQALGSAPQRRRRP